jgi:diguanylate cyclase (GGDEF)-like protein
MPADNSAVKTKIENKVDHTEHFKNCEAVMSQLNIETADSFKKHLATQWKQAVLEKELISVLLCEVDFYSEYIENYGIQAASFMLISIAVILKKECDLHNCFLSINKNSGFTILIKGSTEQDIRAIADGLCKAVRDSKTEHKYSSINKQITMSIGISSLNPNCKTNLKGNAKLALTKSKTSGGNKVSNEKYSQQKVTNEFDLKEQVKESVDNRIDTKRDKEIIEKQKSNTTNSDFFADETLLKNKSNSVKDRTYRGLAIKKETVTEGEHAPKLNNNALNESKNDDSSAQINSKPKKPRMYRGQVISS